MRPQVTLVTALAGFGVMALLGLPQHVNAQEVVGLTTIESAEGASLIFDLGDGNSLLISVSDGKVLIGGTEVARYSEGSAFEQQWRRLVEQSDLSIADVLEHLVDLELAEGSADERAGLAAMQEAVANLAVAEAVHLELEDVPTPRSSPLPRQAVAIGMADAVGDATPAAVAPEIAATSSSFVGGLVGGVMNLAAVYVALAFMGLGLLVFAPRQLETVADTVWHSFWRSFLAGLFAQPLILPVFAMMLVGLALTVVGIIVIPFAVSAFLVALLLATLGGFVAVARSIGEIYLRRKMAQGHAVATWGSYRYIVYGLVPVLGIWLPVALLGSIPVAGTILTVTAAFSTWMMATAGFGATLISRGGLRGTFVRQMDLALTDEQFWTDEAVPTQPPQERIRRSQR
ncbi:MAG: hypothetical protein PVH40_07730 [Gemmatimonadales bacterium]|jgi:hypothetical protein